MKTVLSIVMTFIGLLFLTSCASLTKEECLSSDWQVIGQRDGEQGYDPQHQFHRHIKACEKVNVTPDHTSWDQGYRRGLVSYCTPIKGLRVGQQGKTYANVCPAQSERDFLRGYQIGSKENSVKGNISSLENQSSTLESEIDSLLEKITTATPADVINLKAQINQKRFEREVVHNEKESEIYRLSRIERLIEQFCWTRIWI